MIRDNKNDSIEYKNEIRELLKDYNIKMENNIFLINTEIKKMKSNQEKLNKKIFEIFKRNSISKSKSLKKKKLMKKNSQKEIFIKKNSLKNNLSIKLKNTNSLMKKYSSSIFNKNNNNNNSKNKNYLKKTINNNNNNNFNNNYNSTLSSSYFERYSKKRSTHKSSNSALFSNISDYSNNPSFTNFENSKIKKKKRL